MEKPTYDGNLYLAVLCSAVLIIVSLFNPHKHTAESEKLVWDNPMQALQDEGWSGIGNYKFLTVLLFVTMVVLYVIFSIKPI